MKRVPFIRKELGMTQKQLAHIIGDWPCNIAQVETGQRKAWPKLRTAIAEALGCDEVDLFASDGTLLDVDWQLPRRQEVV